VSIVELGLVEDVRVDAGRVEVDLIPTFSGCPALAFIAADVRRVLGALDGVDDVAVAFVASPAWTPERISPSARRRIAADLGVGVQLGTKPTPCPRCGAPSALREQSLFGPLRCRSVHRCAACGEVVELIR
jgi:ring-1,2-phenylacetyl-CoA epoxidase subunit PaaD